MGASNPTPDAHPDKEDEELRNVEMLRHGKTQADTEFHQRHSDASQAYQHTNTSKHSNSHNTVINSKRQSYRIESRMRKKDGEHRHTLWQFDMLRYFSI